MEILIGVLMMLAYFVGEIIMGAVFQVVFGALFRILRWFMPMRTTDLGVVCWWLVSIVAGSSAVAWWQQEPTPVRLVITVSGCLCLAASGFAMTAAHTAVEAERRAPPLSRISVSRGRAQRRW